jgi:hypothetical protein
MRRTNRRTTREAPQPEPAQMGYAPCCCAGLGPYMNALMGGALRSPVVHHFRNAGVEVLMGLRAILDAQIDLLSRETEKGRKVPVE